ncbi:MAG: hypothetical protein ACTHMB_23790 [Candidatus Binatia bacterium]
MAVPIIQRGRSWQAKPSAPGFAPLDDDAPTSPQGVLVINDAAILLEQWNDKTQQFDVNKRLPFSDIIAVALDSYGVSRRLVIHKKDLSFDFFDFTQGAATS